MNIDVTNANDIKKFLKSCSKEPGVYKMYSSDNEVIYVGKAKNLANRLSSYFAKNLSSPKVSKLVSQIVKIETIVTNTEAESLILECNLIKDLKPKYNILLRDDKSYPYICLSIHDFPRLFLYRGKKINNVESFGPYPNAYAAKQAIRLLQQVFLLRVCTDSYFNNRVRPCLLYQINRCSGPCVKNIEKSNYQHEVSNAKLFLKGRSKQLIELITKDMQKASNQQDYEYAAVLRDQIQKLQQLSEGQIVDSTSKEVCKPIDAIAIELGDKLSAVVFLKFREGKLVTSNQYIIKNNLDFDYADEKKDDNQEFLLSLLSQYYLNYSSSMPEEIIINYNLSNKDKGLLAELLNNNKLKVIDNPRGVKSKWLKLAIKNAHELLLSKTNKQQIYFNKFKLLKESLSLDYLPELVECFDISHTFGKQTVASCVVFDHSGPVKEQYRKYNISNANSDDVFAMKQVLTRRFKKILENHDESLRLVLIDGGKTQLNAAKSVFEELGIKNWSLFGITKGEGRRAINDRIISSESLTDVPMRQYKEALHLLQEVRDEAHRFALVGHRKKRGKEQLNSLLDDIPGIGAKRRKNLLNYLGGWQQVKAASVEELSKVPGISQKMAELVYNYLKK